MKGIKSRLARDTTKFAVVPLLLALAVVLIVMNIKHSMECLGSGEGADEAALKRQALEKRLLALEQEALENSILLEKFIRRLEDKFSLSKAAPLSDLKQASHAEAMFISGRLAEEPAPPMPSFSEMYSIRRRSTTKSTTRWIASTMTSRDPGRRGRPRRHADAYAELELVDVTAARRCPGRRAHAQPPGSVANMRAVEGRSTSLHMARPRRHAHQWRQRDPPYKQDAGEGGMGVRGP